MKIGVLGGSFNPIHNGHLAVARSAMERIPLDAMLFIPAKEPPHKTPKDLAPAEDRLAMAELAVKANDNFTVSDIELSRADKSYTFDTIKKLRESYGRGADLYFLIGADTIGELPTWKDIKELLTLCTFVTVSRPGWSKTEFDGLCGIFSDRVIDDLKNHFIAMDPVPVSSTEIRDKIAHGMSITGLVPEAVEKYIGEHGLYKNG